MCVALPGIITDIKDGIATVDFNGNVVRVRAGVIPVETGDSVLVHAGCIIQKVSKEEADELDELFGIISEDSYGH